MNDIIIGLIGFVIGFIAANFIFYSNNPTIMLIMSKLVGSRQSMMRNMFEEEDEYAKRHKVKFRG